MRNVSRRLLLTLVLFIVSTSYSIASEEDAASEKGPLDVMGTVADHDYFNFFSVKIYLPRIIFWETANGQSQLSFYGSTNSAIESNEFIDQDGILIPADGGQIIVDFSITSHLVYFWFSMGAVILITFFAANKYKKGTGRETEPKGVFQNIFEVIFEFVRDDIAKGNIPENKYKKYVPYLFTVFVGISFMNLFGLLPWAATATADITVTATLALATFLITQFSGTKDHWQHVFWYPGVPTWVRGILTPVEILGLFTKPFALAIRLFANMLSGKIMIIAILGLIFIFSDLFGPAAGLGVSLFSVLLTIALYALKAFVALLQAYIFALLSAVFIGMAAEEHHHEHEDAETEPAVHI